MPEVLLVTCPKCGTDVPVGLVADDAGRGWRATELIDVVNAHIVAVHQIAVSGN